MPILNTLENYTLTSGGGTINLDINSLATAYIINGTATLTSNWTIQPQGSPVPNGLQYNIKWEANITLNGNTITIFRVPIPETLVNKNHTITCYYDGTDWEVNFTIDADENGSLPAEVLSNYSTDDKTTIISVPISFEVGEMGYQRVPLPFYNGFELHSVHSKITKNIEATDDGIVKFYKPSDLVIPYSLDIGVQITFAGNVLTQLGQNNFTNINHPINFNGDDEILVFTDKVTAGGKGMLYFEIIRN